MVPFGTTGAGLGATHSSPAPHPLHPLFGCFLCRSSVSQLHLAVCTGNWMWLKPRSQGKDGSIKNPVRPAQKPLLRTGAVLPCPVPGLPEQRQQNQSQASGTAPGSGEKIEGRKGPLTLHMEAGLKNEIGLRRRWAGALRGAFFPPFAFIINYCY